MGVGEAAAGGAGGVGGAAVCLVAQQALQKRLLSSPRGVGLRWGVLQASHTSLRQWRQRWRHLVKENGLAQLEQDILSQAIRFAHYYSLPLEEVEGQVLPKTNQVPGFNKLLSPFFFFFFSTPLSSLFSPFPLSLKVPAEKKCATSAAMLPG
jgi:hypothetical protein